MKSVHYVVKQSWTTETTGFSGSFEDTNQNCRVTGCSTPGWIEGYQQAVVTFAGSMEVSITSVGSMTGTALHLLLYF